MGKNLQVCGVQCGSLTPFVIIRILMHRVKSREELPRNSWTQIHEKSVNEYYLATCPSPPKPQPACPSHTHKSKYTSTSKLTQSQLYRTLSRAELKEKGSQTQKMKDAQLEILENSLECMKVSEKIFVYQLGELCGQFATLADELQREAGMLGGR